MPCALSLLKGESDSANSAQTNAKNHLTGPTSYIRRIFATKTSSR